MLTIQELIKKSELTYDEYIYGLKLFKQTPELRDKYQSQLDNMLKVPKNFLQQEMQDIDIVLDNKDNDLSIDKMHEIILKFKYDHPLPKNSRDLIIGTIKDWLIQKDKEIFKMRHSPKPDKIDNIAWAAFGIYVFAQLMNVCNSIIYLLQTKNKIFQNISKITLQLSILCYLAILVIIWYLSKFLWHKFWIQLIIFTVLISFSIFRNFWLLSRKKKSMWTTIIEIAQIIIALFTIVVYFVIKHIISSL